MERPTSAKCYRSPGYKLIQFFHTSRDRWKQKCQAGKCRIKRLEKRVAALEISRQMWKTRAQTRRATIGQLTAALAKQKTASD